eukprot:6086296-Amphidinium_carterae.1
MDLCHVLSLLEFDCWCARPTGCGGPYWRQGASSAAYYGVVRQRLDEFIVKYCDHNVRTYSKVATAMWGAFVVLASAILE